MKRGKLTALEQQVYEIRCDPRLQKPPGRVTVNKILKERHGYAKGINLPRVLESIKGKGYIV